MTTQIQNEKSEWQKHVNKTMYFLNFQCLQAQDIPKNM